MRGVGLEPTRLAPADLKAATLTNSDIHAGYIQRELNPRPPAHKTGALPD